MIIMIRYGVSLSVYVFSALPTYKRILQLSTVGNLSELNVICIFITSQEMRLTDIFLLRFALSFVILHLFVSYKFE